MAANRLVVGEDILGVFNRFSNLRSEVCTYNMGIVLKGG